jgi:protein-tyrosine sulfotransferase
MGIYFKNLNSIFRSLNLKYCIIIIFTYLLFKTNLNLQKLETELLKPNSDPKILFIAGSPRSGANLLKVIFSEHDEIKCSDDTHVFQLFLANIKERLLHNRANYILHKNGLTRAVVDAAAGAFLGTILSKISDKKSNICVKERQSLIYGIYVSQILPNSKFIFIIRDARSVLFSIRQKRINSVQSLQFTFSFDYKFNFQVWNMMMEDMYNQCILIGRERCLPIYYEQLVLQPKYVLQKIFKFIDIDWNDNILDDKLYHDSKIKQTNHYINTINKETLYEWADKIPINFLENQDMKLSMLGTLGYDVDSDRPDYNKLDQKFLDKIFDKDSKTLNKLKKTYSMYLEKSNYSHLAKEFEEN